MTRSNTGRNNERREYDDALGQMVGWSLRSETGRQKPSPLVWARLQTQIEEVDRRAAQPSPLRQRALQVARGWQQGCGTLLHVVGSVAGACVQVWQYVDERTVSSETVWHADAHSGSRTMLALRYRLTVQVVCAGPMMGQRLPII